MTKHDIFLHFTGRLNHHIIWNFFHNILVILAKCLILLKFMRSLTIE